MLEQGAEIEEGRGVVARATLAGGAPKPGPEAFYRADEAQELVDALPTVVDDARSKTCLFDFDEAPWFAQTTTVEIGMNEYQLIDDCDNEDGFVCTDMEFTQIELCGQACTDPGIVQGVDAKVYCFEPQ